MHILRMSRWRRGEETQRYFPEWADRFERAAVEAESDRNSYSAGGYAEEFGYRAQPGLPLPARLLAGQPEGGKLWSAQRGALHPGYPECARPLDRDGFSWTRAIQVIRLEGAQAGKGSAPEDITVSAPVTKQEVIQLRRPATVKHGSWRYILSVWKVLRVCARHLDGF